MANSYILFAVTFCSLAMFCNCVLPVKISPVVIDGSTSNACPSQNTIDAELNATKAEIKQAITDTINPILDQNNVDQDNTSSSICGSSPGWTRVAFLNMSDPNAVCPSTLNLHTSPVRGCGRQTSSVHTCDSVFFSLGGQNYTNVCGRVLAYQRGSTDAFYNYVISGQNTIESAYVDGISLTRGPAGSRQHIWTFAAALYEQDSGYNVNWNCPCTNTQYGWPYQLPTFMGNNYFCDTGNPGPGYSLTAYYTGDPLWDGAGCGPLSTCCQFRNPPWFQTTLPQTTTDSIELRVCHGEDINEDTIINLIEIYMN